METIVAVRESDFNKAREVIFAYFDKHEQKTGEEYPGFNGFQGGREEFAYIFHEKYWLEHTMLALMAACIPFKVEYAEREPNAFTGNQGKRISL